MKYICRRDHNDAKLISHIIETAAAADDEGSDSEQALAYRIE